MVRPRKNKAATIADMQLKLDGSRGNMSPAFQQFAEDAIEGKRKIVRERLALEDIRPYRGPEVHMKQMVLDLDRIPPVD